MVYQVLARKWRPKTFNEVIGQDHITRTLQNSVLKKKIAHAYLFTGTRGVGKTTIARIFAKAIRCDNLDERGNPCLECLSCKSIDQSNALDYVEIDGASNNSVDNVRELIENAQYLPTSGKFKVYVVDEVHMLSNSAFNALLKTLEEPPAHVVFIFATTDPHKLLGTVLSRCQRFDFKSVSQEGLSQHVKDIAHKEGIVFDSEESINILARQGNGSVRDTLSLMDQTLSLSAGETITEETVLQSLGLARSDAIKDLTSALFAKNPSLALRVYDEVTRDSVELEKLSNQILDRVFAVIESIDDSANLAKLTSDASALEAMDTAELLWVYEALLKDVEWALKSFDPLRALRFSLLKISRRDEILGIQAGPVKKKPSKVVAPVDSAPKETVPRPAEPVRPIETVESQDSSLPPSREEISWEGFIQFIRSRSRGIAVNLERGGLMSPANAGSQDIIVGFSDDEKIFYDFLNEPSNHELLNSLAKEYFGNGKASCAIVLRLIDNQTKEREKLLSSIEIEEKKLSEIKARKEEQIRNNRFVQEAQALFGGEVTKIILNDEDE